MAHGPQCPCCAGTDVAHSVGEPCWAEIQAAEQESERMAEQAQEDARAELWGAVAAIFPGFERTSGPAGRAELERLFFEGTGPYDLADWIRRRDHLLHPAWGLGDQTVERRLQGPTLHGVEAASISTVQGVDGRWYMCVGFSVPGSGSFSPMGGPPFDSERAAVEAGVAKIRRKAAGILGSSHATATDLKWARKIEAWAQEQLTPQGAFEL